ncbi:MAG: DUF4399 domain-containing protein [Gammaproteobacteria bacterium]|nr:DUF4399 domain-containing protein [Gammaproteobacteria bacterium]
MKTNWILTLALALLPAVSAARTPAPDGAELYFIAPADGQILSSPVTVRFGLRNMGVAPAGVDVEGTGHHHLLVDADLPVPDQPIPNDDRHRHFGRGQTETSLELAPGLHTLQLLLGDFAHVPHDPPVKSDRITITVK